MIAIGLFCLSLIFRIMSGAVYYYYDRDLDFVDNKTAFIDAVYASKKFKPVFKEVKIVPMSTNIFVSSSFSKNVVFKKMFSERTSYLDMLKK